jgi:UDP-N-acetylmuramoylalanine--D-glutamate ligase
MLPDDVARMPPLAFDDQAFLAADGSAVLGIDHCRLSGAHNRRNAGLALAVALAQGADPLHLGQQLASVEPLPHRLEQIHQQDTLHFVDDSIATTPEAAMAALASVSGPVAVVLGGSDKGVDFARLAKSVVQRAAFPVLIGDTARCLHEQLEEQGCNAPICASLDDAMERAVDWLHTEHERNGTVLLSPACASFGMFSDFEERGDRFAAIARSRWPVADETSER